MTDPETLAAEEEVLASSAAGPAAIRGAALRAAGYGAGLVLVAAGSVLLLRHLGVVGFGRYATIMALVAIVSGLTDAGLTVTGQRDYVQAGSDGERRALLGAVVGVRLLLTPLGVVLAAIFALVAGYGSRLAEGVLLAGAGLVLANLAATLTIPLSARLRLGAVTAIDLVKQAALVGGFAALVATGSGLLPFFAIHVGAGLAALGLALALVDAGARVPPRLAPRAWLPVVREAAPIAASLVINVIYVRALIVIASLVATPEQTGLFATSYRVLETFLGLPVLLVGAAFPILARAGTDDLPRLRYALQRLGEAALLVAAGLVVVLSIGAEPVVHVLGGAQFAGAAPVLRIQAFALLGAFMTQVFAFGLVAIRRSRALVAINVAALGTVLVLGLILVPLAGARGGAVAAVAGELVLSGLGLFLLVHAEPRLRPELGYVVRLALAALPALLIALAGLPALAAAPLAGVAYLATAWALRAVPVELVEALVRRRAASTGS